MPVNYYYTTRDLPGDKLYNSIKEWDQRNYSMSGSCHENVYGLTSGHAYTIVGAFDLNGDKVLKIRNPWGSEKYNGPWRDNDPRWTTALR